MRRNWCAVASLLLVSFCFTSFGIAAPTSAPSVQGTVQDSTGSPIAGAKVMLYARRSAWGLDNEVVETAQSDQDGAYRFTAPLKFRIPHGTDYTDYYEIIATHPDYAVGWKRILGSRQSDTYDVVLTEPVKQSFLVRNKDGDVLSGATIWLYYAGDSQSANEALRTSLSLPTNISAVCATTDGQGLATLTNLPKTGFSVMTTLAGYGDEFKDVRKISDKPIELKLTPAGVVRGRVADEDGEPVKSAVVWFTTDWMYHKVPARTDDAGKFEISLVARGGSWASKGGNGTYKVTIQHPDYCSAEQIVSLDPGQTIDDFFITATHGCLVRLTAMDPGTGEPVGGARVGGYVERKELDGYTDENGVCEWRSMPGNAQFRFDAPPAGFYVMGEKGANPVTLVPGVNAVTVAAACALKPMVEVHGKVLLPDGTPARAAKIGVTCNLRDIRTYGQFGFGAETASGKDGTFALIDFPSESHFCAYVETPDRKFAGVGEIDVTEKGGDLGEPIKLAPTQSIDFDLHGETGFEVANQKLSVYPVVGGQQLWRIGRTVKADENGHLKLDGVLPGQTYQVQDARTQNSKAAGTNQFIDQNLELLPKP